HLCTRNRRAVASLMLGLLAGILPLPAIGQNPDLAEPWRPTFKRPTGPPPAAPDNPLTPEKIALAARPVSDDRPSATREPRCTRSYGWGAAGAWAWRDCAATQHPVPVESRMGQAVFLGWARPLA